MRVIKLVARIFLRGVLALVQLIGKGVLSTGLLLRDELAVGSVETSAGCAGSVLCYCLLPSSLDSTYALSRRAIFALRPVYRRLGGIVEQFFKN